MINMNFLRSTLQRCSALILALALLALPNLAEAQAPIPYVAGACYGSDPNDPAAISACIATDSFREWQNDCQDAFYWYLRAVYFDGEEQGNDLGKWRDFWNRAELFPSCSVLSEARALFSGEAFPWAPCIADGSEGSVEHMTSCLRATNSFPRDAGCRAIYDAYDEQVMKTIPHIFRPQIPSQTLSPGEEKVFQGRAQTFRIIQTGVRNSSYVLRLDTRPRDCTVAAQVIENFLPSGPTWLACTGYSAAAVSNHFANCAASTNSLSELSRMTCVDQRAHYEELLTSANLRLPETYRPITCPQIEEGLVLAQQAVAEERAAAVAAQAETAPSAPARSNGRVASWFAIILMIVINIIILVAAVGFAVLNSMRDVRKVPYKRETLKAFGLSLSGWVLAAIVAPAVIQALSGPLHEPGVFWAALLIYSVLGSVGFFGVRLLSAGKHKPPSDEETITKDGFVEADEDGYILHEDAESTAILFFMWPPKATWGTHGRIIEIHADKIIVSDIQKVKKPAWRKPQFEELYASGEWKEDAKTYDTNKIETIRLISETRVEGEAPYHVIVMDYGKKRVELNFVEQSRFFQYRPIGHVSKDQDYMLRIQKTLVETLHKRLEQSGEVTAEHGVSVSFDGVSAEEAAKIKKSAEDMVNSILEEKEPPKRKPPTHDDPF